MKIARRLTPRCTARPVGDRVRLADTSYGSRSRRTSPCTGEEVKFGRKVIRDGMGRAAGGQRGCRHVITTRSSSTTGHRQGRHRTEERPHLEDRQGRQSRCPTRDHDSDRRGHEVIAVRGHDRHRRRHRQPYPLHLPQQIEEALMRASPRCSAAAPARRPVRFATTCTPGRGTSADAGSGAAYPMNLGFLGKGNASQPQPLIEQIRPVPSA